MFELFLVDERGQTALHRVTSSPIYLGRAATNDVVLADPTISSRHLAIWAASGRVFVEDLRSRNGSFVNERPVRGVTRLEPGQTLRLGTTLRLVVRQTEEEGAAVGTPYLVEDMDHEVRFPIRRDRVLFGQMADADVPVSVEIEPAVTLLVGSAGDFYLGVDDDLTELAVDEPFEVAGRRFRIRRSPSTVSVTMDMASTHYPYVLKATLDGPTGPEAQVIHEESGLAHTVSAGNRAVLLYLLARQVIADADKSGDERGWCYDEELITGIWGRSEAGDQANNLSVLLCRTRGELRKAGFDPWFLERRQRNIRARVAEAEVD